MKDLKSGGNPAFPTSKLPNSLDCFHVESLSRLGFRVDLSQLWVRKAGLPPLFHCDP
jgi:hypothetical protein